MHSLASVPSSEGVRIQFAFSVQKDPTLTVSRFINTLGPNHSLSHTLAGLQDASFKRLHNLNEIDVHV